MFSIKIKVKTSLKNITEKSEEIKETIGIKNKNKIKYNIDSIKYNIEIKEQEIILTRETGEYLHGIIFKGKKETKTEYYIKELNISLIIRIRTNRISITKNKIIIDYENIENNNKYIYTIEMSDI